MTEQNQELILNLEPEYDIILYEESNMFCRTLWKKEEKIKRLSWTKSKANFNSKTKEKAKMDLSNHQKNSSNNTEHNKNHMLITGSKYFFISSQNKKIHTTQRNNLTSQAQGKLLIVIRIRGVKDISRQQKLTLNKLGLREVNTAVFVKVTKPVL